MSTTLFDITSLSPLYEAVQMSGIYSDSKYFVDAIPKLPVADILEKYTTEKLLPSFSIAAFVQQYFQLPLAEHLQKLLRKSWCPIASNHP